jgi:hypothetical protein
VRQIRLVGILQTAKKGSMSDNIILGGNGADGSVSVHGKDGQALVELLGRDNEAVIGIGQAGAGSEQKTPRRRSGTLQRTVVELRNPLQI